MSNAKYVAYYRVSTQKQGKSGLGMEAQQAYIKHFFETSEIVAEFTEVESGKNADRPQLQKAINLCLKKGYFLAVAKIDRLSRKTEHALEIYNELKGRLYSCDIPTEKGAKMDKFTLTIYMAIADRERELIGIRTKAALKALKARGIKLGKPENLTSKGRKKAHRTRIQNANKNLNNIKVMEAVAMYKEKGLSLQAIADKLNTQSQDTPSGQKQTRFHKTTITRLYKRYLRLQAAS